MILNKFEENKNLGVSVLLDPIREHFCTWYGYGGHGSFEVTRRLLEQLCLNADLDRNKQPITIGTAL